MRVATVLLVLVAAAAARVAQDDGGRWHIPPTRRVAGATREGTQRVQGPQRGPQREGQMGTFEGSHRHRGPAQGQLAGVARSTATPQMDTSHHVTRQVTSSKDALQATMVMAINNLALAMATLREVLEDDNMPYTNKPPVAEHNPDHETPAAVVNALTEALQNNTKALQALTDEGEGLSPTSDNLTSVLGSLTSALKNNTQALDALRKKEEDCPPPFMGIGGSCYYVNSGLQVSWGEARVFCQGMDADLATPPSLHDLRALLLHKFPENQYRFFWVGGLEAGGTEGNWRWVSGGPVPAEAWARGQPNGGNENCVVISRDDHPPLHDSPCRTRTFFICQLPAKNSTTADDDDEAPSNASPFLPARREGTGTSSSSEWDKFLG